MAWTIPDDWRTPANAAVLAFLERENPSAHADVGEELWLAAAGLDDVRTHCPDSGHYAFVVLIDGDERIFGVAYGTDGFALRVPDHAVAAARADGGQECPEIGADWVRFAPFIVDEPTASIRARLRRWCAIAHGQATLR